MAGCFPADCNECHTHLPALHCCCHSRRWPANRLFPVQATLHPTLPPTGDTVYLAHCLSDPRTPATAVGSSSAATQWSPARDEQRCAARAGGPARAAWRGRPDCMAPSVCQSAAQHIMQCAAFSSAPAALSLLPCSFQLRQGILPAHGARGQRHAAGPLRAAAAVQGWARGGGGGGYNSGGGCAGVRRIPSVPRGLTHCPVVESVIFFSYK